MAHRHGVLAPGQPFPTHPSPTTAPKPGFLTAELDWKRIWAKRWWVIGVLVALYAAGFAVNHGPSMNGLGWVYLQLWGTQPTHDGQIFVFVPANKPAWTKFVPGQQWIKRRVGVTADGRIIFAGDNENWSTDNRDGLAPVPPDHVAGVVYGAISPRRIANYFTKQGRFENWLTWNYAPKEIQHRGEWTVVSRGNLIRMWGPEAAYSEVSGYQVEGWQSDNQLKLSRPISPCQWEVALYDFIEHRLMTGYDSSGELLLTANVTRQFPWGTVSGRLVWAMDDVSATKWQVSAATEEVSVSHVNFSRVQSGTLEMIGGGDAAAVIQVSADGRLLTTVPGQWNGGQLKVPFKAKSLAVRFDKHQPTATSGVASARILLN